MMKPYVLDYRDTAPAIANSTMYINNSRISPNIGNIYLFLALMYFNS